MNELHKLRAEFEIAYLRLQTVKEYLTGAEKAYQTAEQALSNTMIELGISSLESEVGTLKPKVRYKGSFKEDKLQELISACRQLGKDVPIKMQAVYETPLSDQAALNMFAETHHDANKLNVTCHHGTFDKLLRENESLLPLATYVQLVSVSVS